MMNRNDEMVSAHFRILAVEDLSNTVFDRVSLLFGLLRERYYISITDPGSDNRNRNTACQSTPCNAAKQRAPSLGSEGHRRQIAKPIMGEIAYPNKTKAIVAIDPIF